MHVDFSTYTDHQQMDAELTDVDGDTHGVIEVCSDLTVPHDNGYARHVRSTTRWTTCTPRPF
jgi:hypothetical protein